MRGDNGWATGRRRRTAASSRRGRRPVVALFAAGSVAAVLLAIRIRSLLLLSSSTSNGNQESSLLLLNSNYSSILLVRPSSSTTASSGGDGGGGDASRTTRVVEYVGEFGLGHRLSKLSAAYHLATRVFNGNNENEKNARQPSSLVVDEFHHDWGTCRLGGAVEGGDDSRQQQQQEEDVDIFWYLFGANRWSLSGQQSTLGRRRQQQQQSRTTTASKRRGRGETRKRTVLVRNDVAGYYAGQAYKNAQLPVPKPQVATTTTDSSTSSSSLPAFYKAWTGKMDSDLALFRRLTGEFRFRRQVEEFRVQKLLQQQYRQQGTVSSDAAGTAPQSYVVGLHLRMGNGEREHFEMAQRGVQGSESQFVVRLVRLICEQLLGQHKKQRLRPVIFLATDTASWIPVIQNMTRTEYSVETVAYEELVRLRDGEGVSYEIREGQKCLDGWKHSMIDMSLLASSDVVVAASRSTFTQILPRSIVLDGAPATSSDLSLWRYCEVGTSGSVMTCFGDRETWLLRHRQERMRTFVLDGTTVVSPRPILHKLMVHLPDVFEPPVQRMQQAADFLVGSGDLDDNNSEDAVFQYGKRINPKYRSYDIFREDWAWTTNS